jgi:hypothetical protein
MKPKPKSYFKLFKVEVSELIAHSKDAKKMYDMFGEHAKYVIGAKANKDYDWNEYEFDIRCPNEKVAEVQQHMMNVTKEMPKKDYTIYAGEH